MSKHQRGARGLPKRPLLSVEELPPSVHPIVHIEEERRIPLAEHGTRRASTSRGEIDDHIQGILGEDAVGQYFGGLSPDTALYEDGDPGYDLTYRNLDIDVKTVGSHWRTPELWVSAHHPLDADYYVLAQEMNPGAYRLIGYAPREVVAKAPTKEIFAEGTGHPDVVRVVQQYQLTPLCAPPVAVGSTQ